MADLKTAGKNAAYLPDVEAIVGRALYERKFTVGEANLAADELRSHVD